MRKTVLHIVYFNNSVKEDVASFVSYTSNNVASLLPMKNTLEGEEMFQPPISPH